MTQPEKRIAVYYRHLVTIFGLDFGNNTTTVGTVGMNDRMGYQLS